MYVESLNWNHCTSNQRRDPIFLNSSALETSDGQNACIGTVRMTYCVVPQNQILISVSFNLLHLLVGEIRPMISSLGCRFVRAVNYVFFKFSLKS